MECPICKAELLMEKTENLSVWVCSNPVCEYISEEIEEESEGCIQDMVNLYGINGLA